MAGLFGTLNTATGGMNAHQNALQTTSHNLSNINTPGYSRQRVTMKTAYPQAKSGIGQIGMGVQISGVHRVTDDYVTRQLENEMSSFVEQGNISEVLGQLEAVFNEPSDSSVSHQMSEFFSAWGSLSENPASDAGKKLVVSQSETFVDTLNHIANKIDSLAEDTIGQIKKDVLDFNATAEQLKDVNEQIFSAKSKGHEPNDLMDTQDQLIGQLKSVADVEVEKDSFGRFSVILDGNEIVTKDEVKEIGVSKNGEIYHDAEVDDDGFVKKPKEEQLLEIKSGSIKGFQEADETVEDKKEELDEFVRDFAEAVNGIMNPEGSNTDKLIDFFTIESDDNNSSKESEKFTAGNIKINSSLLKDSSDLVVGGYTADNDKNASGDGSRAKAIADLQSSGGFSDDYNEIITDMGIIKQQADNKMDNQADLVALLDQRKESVSGVDMNEEVVDMIQYQSAFQANARMITTINEMLDTLINRTGV